MDHDVLYMARNDTCIDSFIKCLKECSNTDRECIGQCEKSFVKCLEKGEPQFWGSNPREKVLVDGEEVAEEV